jgi:hypothetical protein
MLRAIAPLCVACLLGCVDSRFLRGVSCSDDRDCGRSLTCENGVCGGCPDGLLAANGTCLCPGDRILECRELVSPFCMSICATATEECEAVILHDDGTTERLPPCEADPTVTPCFTVETESVTCIESELEIAVIPTSASPPALIVNCPPAADDSRFTCE